MINTVDIIGCLDLATTGGQQVMAHELESSRHSELDPFSSVGRRRIITSQLAQDVFKRVSFQYFTCSDPQKAAIEHEPQVCGEIDVKLQAYHSKCREECNFEGSQWLRVCLAISSEGIDIEHEVTSIGKDESEMFKKCFKKWGFFLNRQGDEGRCAERFEVREMHNLSQVVLGTLKEFDF